MDLCTTGLLHILNRSDFLFVEINKRLFEQIHYYIINNP